ncbi:rho guanine nucleotide exchange factor 19-like [Malaclemys terrapin pileata]|uniref:rho guanine nucleotide exchange factor 19-like n=1 Tax=Malaclemys terrapin pileata TaxID=2991368 RepID=UPI0023A85E77|nr:rho guanine nucleotide exchange factor 19-like [Malaclemys terrapin pileata]
MDFFCRKRARSDSPPRAAAPVKRHGSCPVAQRPQPARPESRPELCPFLAGLFRPRSAKEGLSVARRGSSREPASMAEEKVPLLGDNPKGECSPVLQVTGADLPGIAVPAPLRCQPSPPTAELAAPESMGPEEPVEEPPSSAGPTGPSGLLEMGTKLPIPVPGRKVLHGSLEDLSKATATQMPSPERRLFRRALGKGAKDTDKWKRESKYVQTQPLYQDYWLKRLKAAERKPKEPAFRVDASLSIAGLLSSSLLGAASQLSSRDYSFCFWQEIPEVKSKRLLEGLTPQQRRLQEAMFEMITSEASYLRSLSVATSHFKGSLALRETLTRAEVHRLFSNLQQVKDVSERFLLELEEHMDKDVFLVGLGAVVLKHCPAFHRVYIPYVTNQMYQEQLMQQLMRENWRFRHVLRKLEEQPVCQRQPLKSFLVLPFQRITRLKILLENILKLVPAGSELASSIGAALTAVGEIVSACNENVRHMKQTEELVLLEKQVEFVKTKSIPLISRGRWLVRAGEFSQVLIQEVGVGYRPRLSTKPIHLHLLSDLLLLSRRRDDGRFSVKDYAQTCHVRAELLRAKPLGLPDTAFLLCLSHNHRGVSAEFIIKAASEAQRQEWISLITSQASPRPVGVIKALRDACAGL